MRHEICFVKMNQRFYLRNTKYEHLQGQEGNIK